MNEKKKDAENKRPQQMKQLASSFSPTLIWFGFRGFIVRHIRAAAAVVVVPYEFQ